AGEAAWHFFAQVDVLQCIAVSLLTLQLLLLVLRSERRMYLAAGILLAGIVVTTPLIWAIDFWKILPIPLAEYFNGLHASLFPVFPWAAFVLAGTLAGYFYLETVQRAASAPSGGAGPAPGQPQAPVAARLPFSPVVADGMRRFAWAAAALIALSFLLEPVASGLYPVYDYWKTSPSFYMLRLGLVMLIMAGLYFYERRRPIAPSSVLATAGRESLLVYTVHLLLLYGNFHGPHFVERIGRQFGFWEVLAVSAILVVLMIVLAYVWSAIKAGPRWLLRTVELGVLAGFIIVFFVGL
ncbi:MAG TPA: heparan-alpha-glucosaminide N-acetyltransferase domain-containing protein, partial [Desulfuromonadaceae bacterium]